MSWLMARICHDDYDDDEEGIKEMKGGVHVRSKLTGARSNVENTDFSPYVVC